MASGDTLCTFKPLEGEQPATNYATLDWRNNHPVLDFDTTTQETIVFSGLIPRNYTSSASIVVYLHVTMTSATSGTVGFDVSIERMSDSSTDLDSDSFATAQTVTAVTVPGTSGVMLVLSVTITNANADGITPGDSFRIRIRRDVANDTAAGDAELHAVEIKEN